MREIAGECEIYLKLAGGAAVEDNNFYQPWFLIQWSIQPEHSTGGALLLWFVRFYDLSLGYYYYVSIRISGILLSPPPFVSP